MMVDFSRSAKRIKENESMATKKTAVKKSTALTKWSEKFAAYAKKGVEQLANVGLGGTSIKLGRGTIEVGDKTIKDGRLEVVLVGFCAHNRWFAGKYDARNTAPPNCYAFADILGDDEMKPHSAVKEPVNSDCVSCDKNAYGSADNHKGKACQNTARLGLLLASDLEEEGAEGVAKMELANASVSPTNVKYLKEYVETLMAEHGLPPWAVVSEIQTFDDPETQIRVEWKLVDLIEDDDVLTALEKRYLKIQDVLQVPYQAADDKAKSNGNGKPAAGASRKFAAGGRTATKGKK